MLCAYSLTHADIYIVASITLIKPYFDPPEGFSYMKAWYSPFRMRCRNATGTGGR